tara:strand:- start:1290 stop:1562 length:273 start_codon:yes stop_codon:yes gene_type:complete
MNVIGTLALIRASLNMRKFLDVLTIVTTILTLGILGTGFFTYRTVTSDKFQQKLLDKVLGSVGDIMPKVLDNNLPSMTGPSLPTTKLPKF